MRSRCHAVATFAAAFVLGGAGLAEAQSGGPDASGYLYGPTVFDFQTLATNINSASHVLGDDSVVTVSLPWAFPFYGANYNNAVIDSNGKLMFNTAAGSDLSNSCLGVADTSPPDIAPFWDDLNPSLGGGIYSYHDSFGGRFIVSWEDIQHFGGGDHVSFQIHLYPSGLIELHWADVNFNDPVEDFGASATVGIQNRVGGTYLAGDALQYSCNTASLIDGTATAFEQCVDADNDGYYATSCGGDDCDEISPTVNPGMTEVCGNSIDDDCSGADGDLDLDGDGGISMTCAGDDCDDADPTRYVGAPELCDQLDNDCNNVVPANESTDGDNDGAVTCADCNDGDPLIFPGQVEVCDGVDQDCDGTLFIGAAPDLPPTTTSSGSGGPFYRGNRYLVSTASWLDHLGWELAAPIGTTITFAVYEGGSLTGPWTQVATTSLVTTSAAQMVHESPTIGLPLNAGRYYAMVAHWGQSASWYGWTGAGVVPTSFGTLEAGASGTTLSTTAVGTSSNIYPMTVYTGQSEADLDSDNVLPCQGDCDDDNASTYPNAPEICDGFDNNCDSSLPVAEFDGDGDGDRPCATDCNDANGTVYGGAPELCDGLDNDCDTLVPANETTNVDGDSAVLCADCNDNDPNAYPGAPETCDGTDQNCDGLLVTIDAPPTPTITGTVTDLLRGQKVQVVTSTLLDSIEAWLSVAPGATLSWLVYESASASGTYTLIDSDTSTTTLPGGAFAWHSSPNFNVQLNAGSFYVLAVAWSGPSVGYAYVTPPTWPIANSFGSYLGGVAGGGAFPTPTGTFTTSTTAYAVRLLTGSEADVDNDSYFGCVDDCDDSDFAVNPGATEVCNGVDDNCDNVLFLDEDDLDGDGGLACDDDCDDNDGATYFGAPELCDGLDNDCDTAVPANETTDGDGDSYVACADCDDGDGDYNPGAVELCDGLDWNCDGALFIGGGAPDVSPAASSTGTGGGRYRGNIYLATTNTSIDHVGWELNTPLGTTIQVAVFESTAINGTYTEVARVSFLTTQTGQVVHDSPSLGAILTAGNYYAVAAEWDLAATWYGWAAPTLPLAVSFGQIVGGATGSTLPVGTGAIGQTTLIYPMTIHTGIPEADNDNDGFYACNMDCDDGDATINPSATELCDGLDNDCDNALLATEGDADNDGFLECDDDCDDANAQSFPGAPEVCDGEDNDCNTAIPADETTDVDNDGSPECADCDDLDPNQTPGSVEVCDGIDADCDGLLDGQDLDIGGTLVLAADLDSSDGGFLPSAPGGSTSLWQYGVPVAGANTVSPGPTSAAAGTMVWGTALAGDYLAISNTAYLTLPTVTLPSSGAPSFMFRYWQNNESDCQWDFTNVQIDAGIGFVNVADGDACAGGLAETNGAWVAVSIDLSPYLGQSITVRFAHTTDTSISNFPGTYLDELYIGEIDDADGDGWVTCGDCDDGAPETNEGATEICDGQDNDCDSVIPLDEGDADNDGSLACADCDDGDPARFPGQAELCDGVDNNCDGSIAGGVDLGPIAGSTGSSGTIYRGNKYLATSTATIQTAQWRLDAPVGTALTFSVWESATVTGTYTQIASAPMATSATGDVFHESPPLNALMTAGNYYAVVANWDLVSGFAWAPAPGFPIAQSFGTIVGGAFGTTLPVGSGSIGDLANGYPMNLVTGLDEVDGDNDGFFACNDCDDGAIAIYPGAPEVCGDAVDDDCDGVAGTGADLDADGVDDCSGDCDDSNSSVYAGAPELCDGIDTDCDGALPADELDADADGTLGCADCDDADATQYPGAVEACNGLDDDCDNVVPVDELDQDNDGLTGCDGDCVDTDPGIPAAAETCDGFDSDCDGNLPAGEEDTDADGVPVCAGDCDDNDAANFPGNVELCDGQDNDCNGSADFNGGVEEDLDSDGSPGCVDCDEADPLNWPGNVEVCDGQDNDCDAGTNELIDFDLDTFTVCDGDCDDDQVDSWPGNEEICDGGIDNDCDPATDEVADTDNDGDTICDGDCDDDNAQTFPGASELCDGQDNNCNDIIPPNEADLDGDGFLLCGQDCDDDDEDTYPGAPELCDGLDNDCDGAAETATDGDGDGVSTCDGDCDDADTDIYPGAPELCDGLDNDCDTSLPSDEIDADADGWMGCEGDCDDAQPLISPDADESTACEDGEDNDCDGDVDTDDSDCPDGDDDDSAGDDDDDGDDDDSAGEPDACACESSVVGGGEPVALAVLLLGFGGLALRRRRL